MFRLDKGELVMALIGYSIMYRADDRYSEPQQYSGIFFDTVDGRNECMNVFYRLQQKYFDCWRVEIYGGAFTYGTVEYR